MIIFYWWLEEMAKLKGLGKGLDALLSVSQVNNIVNNTDGNTKNLEVVQIELSSLQAGKYQPRRVFDEVELSELADSIKSNGVIQPIIVRTIAKDKYEIIAGERRYRASQLAGLTQIPVIIRDFSDEEALAVSLIENIQRKDLNIVEEALGYRRLIDEFSLTHEALAKVTGKSRSNISNTLRLLNLNQYVLDLLMDKKIDMGHARALLPLSAEQQIELADEILAKKLTTAEVENRVSHILHEQQFGNIAPRSKERKDPDIARFEEAVAEKIGMMVAIKHNRSGHGKMTISYSSVEELEDLLGRIN